MAEELALHELGSNGAAVDRNERTVGARAAVVNQPRDEFLAGARLAARCAPAPAARRPCRSCRAAQHRAAIRRAARRRAALAERDSSLQRAVRRCCAGCFEVERLRDEVEGAELERRDGRFDVAVRRDDGDRHAGRMVCIHSTSSRPSPSGRRMSVRAQVERASSSKPRALPLATSPRFRVSMSMRPASAQQFADVGFVVDDQRRHAIRGDHSLIRSRAVLRVRPSDRDRQRRCGSMLPPPGRAARRSVAPIELAQFARDVQAEPGAADCAPVKKGSKILSMRLAGSTPWPRSALPDTGAGARHPPAAPRR